MVSPLEKGNELERSVRAIETAILHSAPGLSEKTFLIDGKKIVVVGDVRHEIDLFVEVDLGQGYTSVFIFECKNWEDAVGKNEIIIFSEKIDAVSAAKGFFVAKSFSKDAQAQAKKDARIELLIATEHSPTNIKFPISFHSVEAKRDKAVGVIYFVVRGSTGSEPQTPVQLVEAQATLHEKEIDLQAHLAEWGNGIIVSDLNSLNTATLPTGTHERTIEVEKSYEAKELMLNDTDIETVKLKITYPIEVYWPRIVSHYEVASRGRALFFEPVQSADGAVEVGFIIRAAI